MTTKEENSIFQGPGMGSHYSGEVDGFVTQTTEVDGAVAQTTEVDGVVVETTCEEMISFTAHEEDTQTAVLAEEFEKRLGNEVKQFIEELRQLENEQKRAIKSVEERMKKAIEDKDKEIRCLEEKTSDYQNDIKGLKVKCTVLKEKYRAQTKYVEDVVMKRMAVSELNDVLNSQNAELQREVDNLKEVERRFQRMKKIAEENESDILSYRLVIDKKNEEIKRAVESEQLMERKLKTLQTDFEEIDREVNSIQRINQALNEKMKQNEEKYEDSAKELEDKNVKLTEKIRRKVKEKESDIESYVLVIDKKNEEIKWAVDSEQSMEQELKTLQRDFEEKERELKSMQTNNTALGEKMKQIEVQNRMRSEYIENTAKKHMALADENIKLKSQISNLQGTIDDLNKVEKM